MVFVQYFGCGQFNPSAKDCIKCDVFQAVVRDKVVCLSCELWTEKELINKSY